MKTFFNASIPNKALKSCVIVNMIVVGLTACGSKKESTEPSIEKLDPSPDVVVIEKPITVPVGTPLDIKKTSAITSIDTGLTISKVRTAKVRSGTYLVGSSYEGALVAVDYEGNLLWTNKLTGFMHHDLHVSDIDGDGVDEILAASADGGIYCVNHEGETLWQFKPNDVPMISVTSVKDGKGNTYIAAGGNDLNFYWLSYKGENLKTVASADYETVIRPHKVWMDDGTLTYNVHTVNHLVSIPQQDGSDVLALNGILGNAERVSMLFQFKPLESVPFKSTKLGYGYGPVGDLRARHNGKGDYELLLGTSGVVRTTDFARINPKNENKQKLDLPQVTNVKGVSYRVVQSETIKQNGQQSYLIKVGAQMLIVPQSMNNEALELLETTYSYNDMWKDPATEKVVLASAQSGGSNIHIIDTKNPNWKAEYEALEPIGHIKKILNNTATLQQKVDSFDKPEFERDPIETFLMSPPKEPSQIINKLTQQYSSPKFMGYYWSNRIEDWDRSSLGSESFAEMRDDRYTYNLTQDEVIARAVSKYNDNGLTMWGGHGVDPFYYQNSTLEKIMQAGNGKDSIFIWPELTILNKEEFPFAVDNLLAPFAESARQYNAKLFLRNKHNFWLANIYSPEWQRFLAGEFADIAIPSMEETQDMTMELSLAGRLGLWAGGVFDNWGTRVARDNPSIMRSRQFSNQMLPNHFLRNSVFHVSYGAKYINNFTIDSKYSAYMSVLWEMIAKGVIYVPKRNEIVSFNPVHLSMISPDERFLREGHSTTTSIRYEKDFHTSNPYVFGRLDGAWTGAENSEWDFSRYAARVKDRRQNFLAPYPNGMVLITPPQQGTFATQNSKRSSLVSNLHPIYKDILKEYYSDGRYYYSVDGKDKLNADQYYKQIENEIKLGAKKLPISMEVDNVAWVAAQTSPKHLRLTLIDGGYINPSDKTATFNFNTVTPVTITDVLTGERIKAEKQISVDVPLGGFRFLDIELENEL